MGPHGGEELLKVGTDPRVRVSGDDEGVALALEHSVGGLERGINERDDLETRAELVLDAERMVPGPCSAVSACTGAIARLPSSLPCAIVSAALGRSRRAHEVDVSCADVASDGVSGAARSRGELTRRSARGQHSRSRSPRTHEVPARLGHRAHRHAAQLAGVDGRAANRTATTRSFCGIHVAGGLASRRGSAARAGGTRRGQERNRRFQRGLPKMTKWIPGQISSTGQSMRGIGELDGRALVLLERIGLEVVLVVLVQGSGRDDGRRSDAGRERGRLDGEGCRLGSRAVLICQRRRGDGRQADCRSRGDGRQSDTRREGRCSWSSKRGRSKNDSCGRSAKRSTLIFN